jgi:hypothetical protein
MKQTVSEYQFIEGFNTRKENFSYEGLQAMFEYFSQLEDDLGEQIEFDPIAICCEYSEYENLADFQDDYGDEYTCIEDIEGYTQVIRVDDDAFIIQQF